MPKIGRRREDCPRFVAGSPAEDGRWSSAAQTRTLDRGPAAARPAASSLTWPRPLAIGPFQVLHHPTQWDARSPASLAIALIDEPSTITPAALVSAIAECPAKSAVCCARECNGSPEACSR